MKSQQATFKLCLHQKGWMKVLPKSTIDKLENIWALKEIQSSHTSARNSLLRKENSTFYY